MRVGDAVLLLSCAQLAGVLVAGTAAAAGAAVGVVGDVMTCMSSA